MSENSEELYREEEGTLEARIEAVLFVAGEPVPDADLAKALKVSTEELNEAVNRLRDQYDFEQRGFAIHRYDNLVQLTTRARYARDIVNLLQPVQRQSLSQAAMETLAVIAYKQPVTKAEIEQIRGVKCDYSLQSLVNKELVVPLGRRNVLGRPMEYGTTAQFLMHFGIEDLNHLPPMPERPVDDEQNGEE